MKKYKFEEFKVEVENPTVEIDLNSIQDKAIDKLLSVDVLLISNGVRFGVTAGNMPYTDTWKDNDIAEMVNLWLDGFELK